MNEWVGKLSGGPEGCDQKVIRSRIIYGMSIVDKHGNEILVDRYVEIRFAYLPPEQRVLNVWKPDFSIPEMTFTTKRAIYRIFGDSGQATFVRLE